MQVEDVQKAIQAKIPGAEVEARFEGNHVHLTVVSSAFEGISAVKKQQMVYAALQPAISSGVIHAVHMSTLTPNEK